MAEYVDRARLWQTYEPQQPGEIVVVVLFENNWIKALRAYKSIRDLEADYNYWKDDLTAALAERGETNELVTYDLVYDMNQCSDYQDGHVYTFLIYCTEVF